jgi:hypothetical protein
MSAIRNVRSSAARVAGEPPWLGVASGSATGGSRGSVK